MWERPLISTIWALHLQRKLVNSPRQWFYCCSSRSCWSGALMETLYILPGLPLQSAIYRERQHLDQSAEEGRGHLPPFWWKPRHIVRAGIHCKPHKGLNITVWTIEVEVNLSLQGGVLLLLLLVVEVWGGGAQLHSQFFFSGHFKVLIVLPEALPFNHNRSVLTQALSNYCWKTEAN